MSFISKEIKRFGYIEVNNNQILAAQYHFECDSQTDLPTQTQFQNDKNVFLFIGSTAHTIADNKKWEMKSDGTWVDITNAPSTYDASDIIYDNTESGMTATNVQDAIDEIHDLDEIPTANSTNAVMSGGVWTDQQRQETEIGVVANAGAKNIFDIQAEAAIQRTTTVLNSDGGITISCNTASWATRNAIAEIPAGDYICSLFVDAVTIGGGTFAFFVNQSNDKSTWTELARQASITSTGRIDMPISVSQKYLRISTNINNSSTSATNSATIRLMLRPASITDHTFQPFACTNRELTVITDEDRSALVELVDGGAKNRWKITTPTLPSGFTATVDADGGLILNGTTGSSALTFATSTQFYAGETVVLSGCPSGGSDDSYRLDILRGANTNYCYGDPVIASDFTNNEYPIRIRIAANYTCENLKFFPMVCTLAAWKISQAYQPYRPSWQEMWDAIQALQSGGNRALTMQIQPKEITDQEDIDER